MSRISYEYPIAVSNYLDEAEDYKEAFSEAEHDVDKVITEAKEELSALLGREVENITSRFVEFDSGNPFHACAYFEVEFDGSEQEQEFVNDFIEGLVAWTGDDEDED